MKNQSAINDVIFSIALMRDIEPLTEMSHSPTVVKRWLEKVRGEFSEDLYQSQKTGQILCSQDDEQELIGLFCRLDELLEEHLAQDTPLSKDDLKAVFTMLQERKLHPRGEFDKQGRFYLQDSELVNVCPPSFKYPYSQMTAGRSLKFIRALVDTYKPQSRDELIALFVKAD